MCAAFLDSACGQDADLREEVESLLKHDRLAQGFLESCSRTTMSTPPEGAQIGSYQILSLLGASGIGRCIAHGQEAGPRRRTEDFAEGVRSEPGTALRLCESVAMPSSLPWLNWTKVVIEPATLP